MEIFQLRSTWSQFIDLISNRIIVNGWEHSKALFSRSMLITQEEIHFCLLEHGEWERRRESERCWEIYAFFGVFLSMVVPGYLELRFLSFHFIPLKDKVNIQMNWYFSCSLLYGGFDIFFFLAISRIMLQKGIKNVRFTLLVRLVVWDTIIIEIKSKYFISAKKKANSIQANLCCILRGKWFSFYLSWQIIAWRFSTLLNLQTSQRKPKYSTTHWAEENKFIYRFIDNFWSRLVFKINWKKNVVIN